MTYTFVYTRENNINVLIFDFLYSRDSGISLGYTVMKRANAQRLYRIEFWSGCCCVTLVTADSLGGSKGGGDGGAIWR